MNRPTFVPAQRDGLTRVRVSCPKCNQIIANEAELWRAAIAASSHETFCRGSVCIVERVS